MPHMGLLWSTETTTKCCVVLQIPITRLKIYSNDNTTNRIVFTNSYFTDSSTWILLLMFPILCIFLSLPQLFASTSTIFPAKQSKDQHLPRRTELLDPQRQYSMQIALKITHCPSAMLLTSQHSRTNTWSQDECCKVRLAHISERATEGT